ncbi:MAG: gliding motility-associated ABC transporter substrate-binding protein GldG, partial [Marinilabiliales bacterium]
MVEVEKNNKGQKLTSRKQYKRQSILMLILVIVLVLLLNIFSSFFFTRFDLTSEKRYTLSDQTIDMVSDLHNVVYFKVYLDGDMLPYGFKRLRNAVKELLDEFRVYGNENIQYEFINPSSSVDKKERESIYKNLYEKGLLPTTLKERDAEGGTSQKIVFPGAIVTYGDREVILNLLKSNPSLTPEMALNNSIQDLEYELSSAIRKATRKEYQKIGFIEGHGELEEMEVADIVKSLSEFYYVDRIKLSGHLNNIYEIKDYACLIIAKPDTVWSEQDKFIIDQYIMNGGKVLWLMDFVQAELRDLRYSQAMLAVYNPLNLEDQLFTYGVRINPVLLMDMQCARIPVPGPLVGAQSKYAPAPWYYHPIILPQGKHPVTKNLDVISTKFPSFIDTVGMNPNVKKFPILKSSKYTKVINAPARISLDIVSSQPEPRQFNKSFKPIAVIL